MEPPHRTSSRLRWQAQDVQRCHRLRIEERATRRTFSHIEKICNLRESSRLLEERTTMPAPIIIPPLGDAPISSSLREVRRRIVAGRLAGVSCDQGDSRSWSALLRTRSTVYRVRPKTTDEADGDLRLAPRSTRSRTIEDYMANEADLKKWRYRVRPKTTDEADGDLRLAPRSTRSRTIEGYMANEADVKKWRSQIMTLNVQGRSPRREIRGG